MGDGFNLKVSSSQYAKMLLNGYRPPVTFSLIKSCDCPYFGCVSLQGRFLCVDGFWRGLRRFILWFVHSTLFFFFFFNKPLYSVFMLGACVSILS